MVLEELHELVETLQRRIAEHTLALQQSEALTRYALIDPLLRVLGWDTGDPSRVLVEFRSPNGSADYALLDIEGQPKIIIEAKRLGTSLHGAVGQVINYCIHDGFEYFAVTDGAHWQLYETNHSGPLHDRLVVELNLQASVSQTCLDALALWQPSVVAGRIKNAATPVVDVPSSTGESAETHTYGAMDSRDDEAVPDADPWYNLSEYVHKGGERPSELRLPSGEATSASSWGLVTKGIVQWLTDQGKLSVHHLPIRTSSGKVLVAERSGTPALQNSSKVGPFLVNTSFTANPQVTNCRTIIERVGLDPADFAVRLQ